ncbi:MAG: hypothetical protein P9L94_01760 [Candidatus Hinthialibacter antarcticus]|nr:hypothetical protein [Candidatus Hinthialibacter antarcticus]
MNQRGRNKTTRNQESGGGNALFTLGLVSVIALLIVGWVMQGGMESLAGKAKDLSNITLGGAQTAENPNDPEAKLTAAPVNVTALQPAAQESSQAELRVITEKWQTKLEQERQEYQRQVESMKTNYESQIKDLEMKMKILQLENKSLRGNS